MAVLRNEPAISAASGPGAFEVASISAGCIGASPIFALMPTSARTKLVFTQSGSSWAASRTRSVTMRLASSPTPFAATPRARIPIKINQRHKTEGRQLKHHPEQTKILRYDHKRACKKIRVQRRIVEPPGGLILRLIHSLQETRRIECHCEKRV